LKKKKKKKIEKSREILKKYTNEVTDLNDYNFLLDLFQNHADWKEKKGVGIDSISVIETKYKNKCFQINRIDGTSTDISFMNCINIKSKKKDIYNACRNAIRSEIVKFKKRNLVAGVSMCPFTGDILNFENVHIDHYDMTFNDMFNIWISNYNEDYLYSKIKKDNEIGVKFIDSKIVEDFKKFHNENTKLRMVSTFANLSILKKM